MKFNRKSLFLICSAIFSISVKVYPQDDPIVQFEATARFDLIGLNNHDEKKYALFHGEGDIVASISSENLRLFKGGEFYIQAMGIFGNQASRKYAGDLQVFSNIESDTRIFLYQCWFKQTFNKLIVKFGQLDMNSDYSVSSWASPNVNSSFGVIPTISLNMSVSIFSYLTAGISFKYLVNNQITVQTAFFNGDPGNYETNRNNLNWHFSREGGWFNISELHFKTKSNLKQGNYKLGMFYHSKNISDPSELTSAKGNLGFFVMGDQDLTSEKNTIKNGLRMFFQLSVSPAKVNMIKSYYGFGLIYRGMFRRMNEDEFTVAVASAHINDTKLDRNPDLFNQETAIELTYKKYLKSNFIFQPDFQYIIHPGANRLYKGNVTVGLLRTILTF